MENKIIDLKPEMVVRAADFIVFVQEIIDEDNYIGKVLEQNDVNSPLKYSLNYVGQSFTFKRYDEILRNYSVKENKRCDILQAPFKIMGGKERTVFDTNNIRVAQFSTGCEKLAKSYCDYLNHIENKENMIRMNMYTFKQICELCFSIGIDKKPFNTIIEKLNENYGIEITKNK